MAVGPEVYKEALRKFATGVTVVTVSAEGEMHGMTASSFASASLSPPLILVCLGTTSRTHSLLLDTGLFGVSILSDGDEEAARAFANKGAKPFERFPYRIGDSGVPLLEGAIAWLECTVTGSFPGGDHDVVLGEVQACGSSGADPLLYYDRTYRSLRGL